MEDVLQTLLSLVRRRRARATFQRVLWHGEAKARERSRSVGPRVAHHSSRSASCSHLNSEYLRPAVPVSGSPGNVVRNDSWYSTCAASPVPTLTLPSTSTVSCGRLEYSATSSSRQGRHRDTRHDRTIFFFFVKIRQYEDNRTLTCLFYTARQCCWKTLRP